MKKIMFSKIVLALMVLIFAFVSAQTKLEVKLVGETQVDNVGGVEANDDGNNSPGPANFKSGGSFQDEIHLGFTATIDNVVATMKIREQDNDAAQGFEFDSASLEIKDLFDGLLTLKFYDIGFSAGKNNVIRPDLGSHGVKFTIKPIDLLSIGLGYGINSDGVYSPSINAATSNSDPSSEVSRNLHMIQVDLGVNNAFVPLTVYFGTMITDGSAYKLPKNAAGLTTDFSTNSDNDVKLAQMSVGLTADLLAFLKAGVLNLDLGFGLPTAGTRVYDFSSGDVNAEFKSDFNVAAILHGSASDIGVEGLGLSYYLHYILDTYTKALTFDDFDNGPDDADGFLKVEIEPSYTIGQFTIDLQANFVMVGKKEAYSFVQGPVLGNGITSTAVAYNKFRVEPEIKWTPAAGNSVSAYFRYYNDNMEIKKNGKMRLGFRYNLLFGIEGI